MTSVIDGGRSGNAILMLYIEDKVWWQNVAFDAFCVNSQDACTCSSCS